MFGHIFHMFCAKVADICKNTYIFLWNSPFQETCSVTSCYRFHLQCITCTGSVLCISETHLSSAAWWCICLFLFHCAYSRMHCKTFMLLYWITPC